MFTPVPPSTVQCPVVPTPDALFPGGSPVVLSSLPELMWLLRDGRGHWSVSSPGSPGEEALGRETLLFHVGLGNLCMWDCISGK